jgi:hypothetical protein
VHAKSQKLPQTKKAKVHGRAGQAHGPARTSFAPHGRGAEQSQRSHPTRAPSRHPHAKPKPKHHRLPGPIGEHPVPAHGKQK